jgi:hypothetical protein
MKSKLAGMTRRKFLLSGTLITGVFASLTTPYGLPRSRSARVFSLAKANIEHSLRELFSDIDAARGLGKRYMDLYPREAQRIVLLDKLLLSAPGTSRELKTIISREREYDFRDNRTIIIDGWLLARTEVEVCALTIML